MKRIKNILAALALLALGAPAFASQWTWGGYLINEPTLSYSTTPVVDTVNVSQGKGPIDTLAMQATYVVASTFSKTFDDGTPATGTLTVLSTSTLTAARGTNTIQVVSNTFATGAAFTLLGKSYAVNDPNSWARGTTTTNTATSISSLVDAIPGFDASVSSTTVTISCASSGTYCNSIALTDNTASLTIGGATFSGGANNLVVGLGGFTVTAGTNFTPVSTTSGTAAAILTAFGANANIVAIATSSRSNNVIYSTAVTAGTAGNSLAFFSNSSSVTVSGLSGGTASDINTTASSINVPSHGISGGTAVLFTVTAGAAPGTLAANTTYYAIAVDANNLKLASSQNNALAGTAVAITTQTQAGGGTFALKTLPFSGTAGFKWQSSNDGTNYYDLSTTSATITSSNTSATTLMWDGPIYYRYLRLNFSGPSQGGVNLKVIGNGKSGGTQ